MTDYIISSGQQLTYDVASGDTLTVLSGGTSLRSIVRNGGEMIVSSGGTASAGEVADGGVDLLEAGAVETGVTVGTGARLELGAVTVSSGQTFALGPQASAATISGAVLKSGALVWSDDAVVQAGGYEQVLSRGRAIDTTVQAGGHEVVSRGGIAVGATVTAGGVLLNAGSLEGGIADAGLLSGGSLLSGATLDVGSGGALDRLRIVSATVELSAAATASRITVSSGGELIVASGATAMNLNVTSGGSAVIDGVVEFPPPHVTRYAGFGGSLSGSGTIDQDGQRLALYADASDFTGSVVVGGGRVRSTLHGSSELRLPRLQRRAGERSPAYGRSLQRHGPDVVGELRWRRRTHIRSWRRWRRTLRTYPGRRHTCPQDGRLCDVFPPDRRDRVLVQASDPARRPG